MNTDISDSPQKSVPSKPKCVICGGTDDIELHHVGGRNHIPKYKVPLCRKRHQELTEKIRIAGGNMSYTPNKKARIVRALMAIMVFVWTLLEDLSREIEEEVETQ